MKYFVVTNGTSQVGSVIRFCTFPNVPAVSGRHVAPKIKITSGLIEIWAHLAAKEIPVHPRMSSFAQEDLEILKQVDPVTVEEMLVGPLLVDEGKGVFGTDLAVEGKA